MATRRFLLLTALLASCGPPTLSELEEEIFAKGCSTSGCHDAETAAGQLVLAPGLAYASLVGRASETEAAKEDGWVLVQPGDPAASFLLEKLRGSLDLRYGVPMPWGGQPLSEDAIEAITEWIRLGAKDD